MATSQDLPATKRAHTYCTKTREYIGDIDALLSPIEGIYPLPFNATFADLGEDPGPQKTRRLLADGSAWEVVPDFRSIGLWNTESMTPLPNMLALGDSLPAGVTDKAPTYFSQSDHKANRWDADKGEWLAVPDYRGSVYWTADGASHTISELGVEPPAGALESPPAESSHVESSSGVQTSEQTSESEPSEAE